ncbi:MULTISPECIES: thiol reductant ABC exporter subunit CydD [unclassified Actinotalea]|uniref:thiol reductant ABC exporter subunit CydD n=1 Tax=unclassified Actinotalea TaxID=2638618 RepID=UPI0015F49965|nr:MULTISPECIES: thiol reductant ABC exporter subunit CydD [unclassified Actinotalea]
MKPLDPRLLRRARSARRYVVLTAGLGALTAGLVVAQALLLAAILAPVVGGTAAWADVAPRVAVLAGVVVLRALVTGAQERFAHRSAVRAVAELRSQVVEHAVALGPRGPAHGRPAAVATLATRGLDALEPYFVRYLPQLLLAATVTPATLLVVLDLDWVAAATIAATLPLVPLFMVLVGRLTQSASERRLAGMERLGHQVLDLLVGLPTLRALGRERGPAARVQELGDAHRRATMGTLRIAFLSGMVLELLTTLAVALVAVGVGFRLVSGGLDLQTGLAVLVLAPEVYLPLRQVGAHFHASADGVAAADRAFAVLDTPLPDAAHGVRAPDLATTTLRLRGVGVDQPGRATLAPADLTLTVPPGRVVALAGPNGSGKSTAVAVLLGLVVPDEGDVELDTPAGDRVALRDVDLASYWSQVAWVPQRPVLEPGTVRDAVLQGRDVPAAALDRAARRCGLDEVLAALPDGWDTVLGHGGVGLSLGQRQRVALTRALVANAPLVVLDEPTAHLDAGTQGVVLETIAALRAQGRTVVLVAHRPELLATADDVVMVGRRPVAVPDEPAVTR